MKKQKLFYLAIIPFLIVSCSGKKGTSSTTGQDSSSADSSIPVISSNSDNSSSDASSGRKDAGEMVNKTVQVTVSSNFSNVATHQESCQYNDVWFLEDSSNINYNLALVSALASSASYSKGESLVSFLNSAGYASVQKNQYYAQGITLEQSAGALIGKKTIKDSSNNEYTLLAVFPRSVSYNLEWVSNFTIGENGIHEGFLSARDEVLRFMKNYISTNQISGKIKVWSAGYSRGAAIANLVGGFLAEKSGYFGSGVSLDSKDLFVYTTATPANIPSVVSKKQALSVSGPRGEGFYDTNVAAYAYPGAEANLNLDGSQYKGIHNFVAAGDYVTKLPPKEWSFTRYGKTEEVIFGDEAMVQNLRSISPEVADKFADGKNYKTALPLRGIDFQKAEFVNLERSISADDFINERIGALANLINSRSELATQGYGDILVAAGGLVGDNMYGLVEKFKSEYSAVIKAGAFTYLAYAAKSLNLSDAKAVSSLIMDLMDLMGKTVSDRENYTDQQFLTDALDFLINDEAAVARSQSLKTIFPAPYGDLYIGLLNYAKAHNITPKNVDNLLELLACYVNENKEDPAVDGLIDTLSGIFPDQYITYLGFITQKSYKVSDYESPEAMKKAAILDLVICCALGNQAEDEDVRISASQMRFLLLNIVTSMLLSDYQYLDSLLLNGAIDSEDNVVVNEPNKLELVVADILKIAITDEEKNPLSLEAAANLAIQNLLEKCKSNSDEKYVEVLKANPEKVRDVFLALLINPGNQYSLTNDIVNALAIYDMLSFVYPSHFNDMYICYLKTKISA